MQKVFIVDDQENWIIAIRQFLEKNDILVIGDATNEEDALNTIQKLEIDVVLLDINLTENNLDGIELAKKIKQISNAKIIMLTSLSSRDIILDAYSSGADDYVFKHDLTDLTHKIQKKVDRELLPEQVLLHEFKKMRKKEQLKEILNNDEVEVIMLAEQGMSKTQIMNRLYLSSSTFNRRIKSIKQKLETKSFREAVMKIVRLGFKT